MKAVVAPVGLYHDCILTSQDWKVPQAWFAHFYDVGVLANAVTIYLAFNYSGWSQVPSSPPHLPDAFSHTLLFPKMSHVKEIRIIFGLPLLCEL